MEEAWRAITPHLDQALELDGEARERWLADLHSHSPAVAVQVRAYLAELQKLDAGNFMGVAPAAVLMAGGVKGQRFGAYTLDHVIGQGGMGTVWLADRSDGQFEGRAAVKILNAALAGLPPGARFTPEASILAKLQHPNIAHLLDAGVAEGGQPYLVLEYIRGEHIDRYCERHALTVEQRIRLFLDVLGAVAHAHSNLLVHRDLKPSNILVTGDGAVKLLDFSVAAPLSGSGSDSPLSAQGMTPGYAAPEQLLGQPVTTATDVYALGMVLFVMLAGRHPLVSEEVRTSADLLRLTLEKGVPRLSEVRPDKLLKGDLEAIVGRAIAGDPLQRYTTTELFAQDLQRYLALEPVAARPRSFGYVSGKFIRRNSVAICGVSVALVAIMAAAGFALWQMLEANRQRNLAQEQAARAEATRDFLQFVLTDAGASGKPFTTSELLSRAEKSILAQYGSVATPAALDQLINLAVLNIGMGQHRKAQELLESVQRRAASASYRELQWRSACALASTYQYTGKMREAELLFVQTLPEVRKHAPDSAVLVDCLQQEADVRLTKDDIAGGLAAAREAVMLAGHVFAGSPQRQVAPRIQLAIASRLAGDLGAADSLYGQILGSLHELGRERTADAVNVYSSWGAVKSDGGDILGAARLIETALEVGRALRPDESPDQYVSVNYAKRLVVLNRFDEAERYLQQAHEVGAREGDLDMQIVSLLALAAAKRERGDLAAAGAVLDTAASFVTAHFPQEHPAAWGLRLEAGLTRLAAGSFTEAKPVLLQVAADYARAKTQLTNQIQALAGLARVELSLGDLRSAAAYAEQARNVASRFAIPGQPSYWVGYSLLVEARVKKASNEATSAVDLAARAMSQLAPTIGSSHPLTVEAAGLAGR